MNVNSKDWLIVNGVIVKYMGNDHDITIPYGVTEIGPKAFYNKAFYSIYIPEGVVKIGKRAFQDCNLSEVSFPNSLKIIDDFAFKGNCISKIILGSNTEYVGKEAFYTTEDISYMSCDFHIPSKNIYLGTRFYGATNYYRKLVGTLHICAGSNIRIEDANKWHFRDSEQLFKRDLITNISIDCKGATDDEINDTIDFLVRSRKKEFTFINLDLNTSLIDFKPLLSNQVTIEGKDNLYLKINNGILQELKCSQKELYMPEGVISLDAVLSFHCNAENIILPESLQTINTSFKNTKIKTLVIPQNVISVNPSIFKDCTSLRELVLLNEQDAILYITDKKDLCNLEALHMPVTTKLNISAVDALPKCTFYIDCAGIDYDMIIEHLKEFVNAFGPNRNVVLKNLNYEDLKEVRTILNTPNLKLESETNRQDVVTIDKNKNIATEAIEKVNTINELVEHLEPEQKANILKKVNDILDEYRVNQNKMKPSLYLETERKLALTSNIRDLYNKLLSDLDRVIYSLNLNIEGIKLLNDLNSCEHMLHNDEAEIKIDNIETSIDKIKYIIAKLRRYPNMIIHNTLQSLLDETQQELSITISELYKRELVLESPISKFDRKLDELYDNAFKFFYVMDSINGIGTSDLANDFNELRQILDFLDNKNRERFMGYLNSLITEYQSDTFNRSIEEIELEIRTKLDGILNELKEIINTSTKYKNIIDSMTFCSDSLKIGDIKSLEKDNLFGSEVAKIIKKTPSEYESEIKKELLNIFDSFSKEIQGVDIREYFYKTLEEREQKYPDIANSAEHAEIFKNFNDAYLLYILIMKKIDSIEIALKEYTNDLENYNQNKKSI